MPDDRILNYASNAPDADGMVTLGAYPPMEAELVCSKLESEDIHCFASNSNIASVHPLLNIPVAVQVRREDLDRARALLAAPPPAASPEGDDYADEEWRCPKCRRKSFDLLPLTPGRQLVRNLWVVLLVAGLAWMFIPTQDLGVPERAGRWIGFSLFTLVLVLGAITVTAKRGKRCRECGYTKDP